MSSILITGIHGFVGNNLVTDLKDQHKLYGLDIVFPQKAGVLKTYAWDELETLPPVDIVIHLAGKAHDTKNLENAQSYFDINTGLTKLIFNAFLSSEARKFIFFSSVKAVADTVGNNMLTEEKTPNPATPYGQSKLAAEEYILNEWTLWKDKVGAPGRDSGEKKVYILRPCMIHGPGNKGNLNLLFKLQQWGLPWPLGAFDNSRSFCSIDNVLFVIQQLIENNIEPGIYQLADDESLSTNELIGMIAASQNKKIRIWSIPVKSIEMMARIGDFIHLPLNSERLKKLTESYLVSNQKIKEALKINKMPVTAMEGLLKTLKSFRT